MTNPQTCCSKVRKYITDKNLEIVENYGCCAFVLLWCLGIEPDDLQAIELICKMIDIKAIDEKHRVVWAPAIKFLTGREVTVEFKEDIKDILWIKDRTPVRYEYKGNEHWVGVERGMIAFNPLEYSQCVDKGRPMGARLIKLK